MFGRGGRAGEQSGNGSRGAVICGLGRSSPVHGACMVGEETSVDAAGGGMSCFSESGGDNADAIGEVAVESHLDGHQEAEIQDRTDSRDVASAQSTGKVDPQAPGWTKWVRVGNQPPDRAPCPERIGALEQTIRGYAKKLGEHVFEPAIGLTFDSLGEAYDFYNLYSWEQFRREICEWR
ncbi:hypothetical protein ACQJBY_022327 [Aegilops geniculata]